MIDEDLYALLAAIVPASPGVAPDNTTPPYCVYGRADTTPQNVLEQASGVSQIQFEIDLYATTLAGARALAAQVKLALQAAPFGGYVTGDRDLYEATVKLFYARLTFEVFA